MSRSSLPESSAERIAVAFTVATLAALIWVIAAAPQDVRTAAFAAAGMVSAAHVDERMHEELPAAADHFARPCNAPKASKVFA